MKEIPKFGSQRRLIYDYFTVHEGSTTREAADLTGIPLDTIQKEVCSLRARGLLVKSGQGGWLLAPSQGSATPRTDAMSVASPRGSLIKEALSRYREIPGEIEALRGQADALQRQQDILASLLKECGVPTGEAVYSPAEKNENGTCVGRTERARSRQAAVLEVLRSVAGPMSTREVYDSQADHFGYGHQNSVKATLSSLVDKQHVICEGLRGDALYWRAS